LDVQPPNADVTLPADIDARGSPDIAKLTQEMTEGNEMAYRMFFDAYFNRLWRYLLVVAAGNEDTARETLQATLIRVARHIKPFRDETVFWSWLTVLARSAYKDETRKRRRYFSFLDRFTSHTAVALDNSAVTDADGRLEVLLSGQIALLPTDEQKLIVQKYSAHRSVRELADEMQTTEKAIESKLSRIRQKLKAAALAQLNDESGSL
jgi:RNA polymerase sigma-70 factor (ECF subfamily)